MSERLFPIVTGGWPKATVPHPASIPWSVAEKAYSIYAAKYGRSQTLERLAERGGFYPGEMDEFYPPWREESSEIATLTDEVARMRERCERMEGVVEAAKWARKSADFLPRSGGLPHLWEKVDALAALTTERA